MKTLPRDTAALEAAPIVALAGEAGSADAALPQDVLGRARAFAQPLLTGQELPSGEPAWDHAEGVAGLLRSIGAAPSLQAAAYLVYAGEHLQRPEEAVTKGFGAAQAQLVMLTHRLEDLQRTAREAPSSAEQIERVRKMLLAFAHDLRVVLLRLASRLQSLRWYAATKTPCPAEVALEARQVFAPLANRLGIWQIKWELEDLAFRTLEPEVYQRIASQLALKRTEREARMQALCKAVADDLNGHGIAALVSGRPKHLYSIWRKMQGKQLDFDEVLDVQALRVIVADVPACYAALSRVHERYPALPGAYDDYIAKPKPNGYRSLHTAVRCDDGRPLEVQIRSQAMHDHAEYGVAAHWAYKEAGTKGYAGVQATGSFETQLAEARKGVLKQLLAWERDLSGEAAQAPGMFEDRIYVLTPQATVVELTAGATPVDFAYAVHTQLGHRCRGAKVDGALVPLSTPLRNGQTVEITAAKEGGPSRDWLNPELGFLHSPRARAKVRAWFNAQQQAQVVARGREVVERLLQREGRTALKHDALAAQLGFKDAEALFMVVGKDEYSLRQIEQVLRPMPEPDPNALVQPRAPATGKALGAGGSGGGVLVVGVGSLLTTLARCCGPAPPDAIGGFVTRGKGVAIHRSDCANWCHMAKANPERVVPVAWDVVPDAGRAHYLVNLDMDATDRPGVLRDVTELLARLHVHVASLNSASARHSDGSGLRIALGVAVASATALAPVLAQLAKVPGVRQVRRR